MKSILTLILLAGVVSLSSCSNKNDGTTNTLIVPSADSVSQNSTIKVFLSPTDSFAIQDLTVKNIPVEYLFASDTYNPSDTTWTAKVLVSDYTSTKMSMNLTAISNMAISTGTSTGTFYVTSNSSTLTDFTNGENKTYQIMNGSSITITSITPAIAGTMVLNLHYNSDTIYATGSFQIYQ